MDKHWDNEYRNGGSIKSYGEVWITNALTTDKRILSEIFDYPMTHEQLYDHYKKQGYEIKESQIHKITNRDVLQNYKDALANYIKQKFSKNINWDLTLIPYSVVQDKMIIGSHSVSTSDGNEIEINPNYLFDSFANGGGIGNDWFWNHAYRHYMRDASLEQRNKVKAQFIKEGLELDGESPRHSAIISSIVGEYANGGGVERIDKDELINLIKTKHIAPTNISDLYDKVIEKYMQDHNVSRSDAMKVIPINSLTEQKVFFANGGGVERIDLFEDYENIPTNIQEILDEYSQDFEDGNYDGLAKALEEVESQGYTFEYYLDGQAYGLRPIGVPLNELKGYEDMGEEYAGGGAVSRNLADKIIKKLKNKGYSFGDNLKLTEKFNGKEINLNFYFKFVQEIDEIEYSILQIQIISKYLDFDRVDGLYETDDVLDWKLYKGKNLVCSIVGYYDDALSGIEYQPTVIKIGDIESSVFDFFPRYYNGDLDDKQLEKNLKNALNEIKQKNLYSAVVSLEGYEQYSEKVDGLENAKQAIQDIKENTRFQVVKGDVAVGDLIKQDKVIENYAEGGGIKGKELWFSPYGEVKAEKRGTAKDYIEKHLAKSFGAEYMELVGEDENDYIYELNGNPMMIAAKTAILQEETNLDIETYGRKKRVHIPKKSIDQTSVHLRYPLITPFKNGGGVGDLKRAVDFGKKFIKEHPEHKANVLDFFELMKDEISEGSSVDGEINSFITACNDLIREYKNGGAIKTDFNELENTELRNVLISFWNDFFNNHIGNYLSIEKENYILSNIDNVFVIVRDEDKGNFSDVEKQNIDSFLSPYFDSYKKPLFTDFFNNYEIKDNKIIIYIKDMYANGGGVGKSKSFLHLYKLTYPNGQYIVESYDGEYMTPKEALEKMRITLRGYKSYQYSGASSDSENYKKWYDKKDIGYSDTEAWDEVFGSQKYANGGGVRKINTYKDWIRDNPEWSKFAISEYKGWIFETTKGRDVTFKATLIYKGNRRYVYVWNNEEFVLSQKLTPETADRIIDLIITKKNKYAKGGGVDYDTRWAEMEAYSPYTSRAEYENKKEYEDLAFASKTFSKTSEMLVRENLNNGEICMCKLTKILGHEPNYPIQIVGSLKLEKCFMKRFYRIV